MTIDERLEFLLQSSESLHATVQENTANIAALFTHITALTKVVEIDAENIRHLADIAAAHEQRLDGLEGGAQ
jgi:hypothetical protein